MRRLSDADRMNPYHPTQTDAVTVASPVYRTPRTYLEAALIGLTMSLIAPICNAIYCDLVLSMPFSTTVRDLLMGLLPIACFFVILAMGIALVVPRFVSRIISGHQGVVAVVVHSLLFSIYFSMLGAGSIRGGVTLLGFYVTFYALAPALIAGFGAFLHVIARQKLSE